LATESGVATEVTSELQLTAALAEYLNTVPENDKKQAQAELAKFSRWVGSDRLVSTLAPPEIGEYSDTVSAKGTAPGATERLAAVKLFLAYLKKNGFIETGLAQHLRVRKGRTAAGMKKTTAETTVVQLTKQGHSELVKRLEGYRGERQHLSEEIHRAAQDKDVRENAPLEAAREAQGLLMSKIAEAEATLRAAVIIDESGKRSSDQIVRLGSNITLQDAATGKSMACQIVEANEANPLNSKISNVSPVGAAVIGKAVGDEVTVSTPGGDQTYLILKTR
jgi:transcription elongation factor GreA